MHDIPVPMTIELTVEVLGNICNRSARSGDVKKLMMKMMGGGTFVALIRMGLGLCANVHRYLVLRTSTFGLLPRRAHPVAVSFFQIISSVRNF